MRAVLAISVWAMLPVPGLAAQPEPHPPLPARPAPVAPVLMPRDGTVIKPAGPVDPGIQAKTPPASHFPMPVIRPGVPVEPPPR